MERAVMRLLVVGGAALAVAACDDPTRPERAALAASSSRDVPTNVVTSPRSDVQIDVQWTDGSSKETGFEVHRSESGSSGLYTLRARTAANVTTHHDIGLTPVTQYCYKVRSYQAQGSKTSTSGFSAATCSTTHGGPPAPSNVDARALWSATVAVTWTHASTPASTFRVERAPSLDGSWTHVATPSSPGFQDGDVTPEMLVCYRVTAVNAYGVSTGVSDCTIPPGRPEGLEATSGDAQSIDLSWRDNATEDGYEIERRVNGVWSVAGVVAEDVTTFHDAGLIADREYAYRIRARRDGGYSSHSLTVIAMPVGTVPTAPSALHAFAGGSTSARLTWTSTAINADAFRVERSTDLQTSWNTVAVVDGDTWMTDTGLIAEQTVCYRVVATNRLGESAPSPVDCVTPLAHVADFVAAPLGNGTIGLTWTDRSTANTGYQLQYLATVWGGTWYGWVQEWTTIVTLGANATSYQAAGLPGTEFHEFQLLPYGDDALGDASEVVGSWTDTGPVAPTDLTWVITSGGVELRWTDNSGEEAGFLVQRCVADWNEARYCTSWVELTTIATLPANTTSFRDTGAVSGSTSSYRVVAFNSAGGGRASEIVMGGVP